MLKRLRPDQVTLGMYVRKFGGSWFFHPFWRARFVVKTDRQLARIHAGDAEVIIDTARGSDLPAPDAPSSAGEGGRKVSVLPARRTAAPAPPAPPPPPIPAKPRTRVVAPAAFGKADKARAAALAQRSTTVVRALFENCRADRALSSTQILSVVDDIASTLEQNSGAFINVTRLKSKDDDTYTHSVAVCALMIGLAREAGLAPPAVRALGTAGLLHDIGKVLIDDAILKKTDELSAAEMAEIRRHPELGHGILAAERGLPPVVLDVCIHHHERLDGSGYPFGLAGDAISQAARMAAICDIYDAMTSDRPYKKGIAPTEAIARLEVTEHELDLGLLFKFMRSVGVFPTGKLVRLRSNRLAVVLPTPGEDRRPLVRAFYSTTDSRFTPYQDAVLSDRLSDDQALNAEDPSVWFSDDWPTMRAAIMAGRPFGAGSPVRLAS